MQNCQFEPNLTGLFIRWQFIVRVFGAGSKTEMATTTTELEILLTNNISILVVSKLFKEYVQFLNRLYYITWLASLRLINRKAVYEKGKPYQTRLYKENLLKNSTYSL